MTQKDKFRDPPCILLKMKKKHDNNTGGLVGLGHGHKPHNTSLRDNNARSDWDVDTDDNTPLGPRLTTFSTSCSHRRVQPRTEKESRKTDRTAPKKATAMRDLPP